MKPLEDGFELQQLIGTETCNFCATLDECLSLPDHDGNPLAACKECIFNAFREHWGELGPMCEVHARLDRAGELTVEIGNDCVACSLHERTEILALLASRAPADGSKDSLNVLAHVLRLSDLNLVKLGHELATWAAIPWAVPNAATGDWLTGLKQRIKAFQFWYAQGFDREKETLTIALSPTATMKTIDGAKCRVWEGMTNSGTEVFALIAVVGLPSDADSSELERHCQQVTVSATVQLPHAFSTDN